MEIDLVPVNQIPSAPSAPAEVPSAPLAPAEVPSAPSAPAEVPSASLASEPSPAEVPSAPSAPAKRGRGRPPGAKNKKKVQVISPQESLPHETVPLVQEALPLATPRGEASSSYEQARESLLPPKPMTPLELSRHLRELSSARQQEKRSYYNKMLAHLM